MSTQPRQFILKDAVKIFLALATIAGLYLAAIPFNLVWLFWWLLALSMVVSLLLFAYRVVRPKADAMREWIELGKKYPALLATAGRAQVRLEELEIELANAQSLGAESLVGGIAEGRLRAVSELRGNRSKAELELMSMSIVGNQFFIAAELIEGAAALVINSHFYLRVRGLEEIKAVLRAESVSGNTVRLQIQEVRDVTFMEHLVQRAQSDASVPRELYISRRRVVRLAELLEEGS